MDISYKYSYIAKTFLMSMFYLPLLPVGILISALGIALTYFIEKFNLLRTYKRPDMLNQEICKFFINYFKIMIFVLAIGNWIFNSEVYNTKLWSTITIVVTGCSCLIPFKYIFKCYLLGYEESEVNKKTYLDSYFDFATDYERENPITKLKGNIHYLERLRDKNYITKEKFDEMKEKMEKESVNMIELYYRNNKNFENKANKNNTLKFISKASKKLTQNIMNIGNKKVDNKKLKALSNVFGNINTGYQSNNNNFNMQFQGLNMQNHNGFDQVPNVENNYNHINLNLQNFNNNVPNFQVSPVQNIQSNVGYSNQTNNFQPNYPNYQINNNGYSSNYN